MAASRLGSSLRDADLAGLGAPGLIGGVKAQAAGSSRELTKWQTALLVGVPLAAVAVAGAAILFYLRRRRRRRLVEEEVPVEDRSATPVPLGAPEGDAAEEPAAVGEAAGAEGEGGDATNRPSALDQARAIKQRGNDLYKQAKFDEAIKCYEEAIQVCPDEKKSDIAMFYQNIAAVYDALALKATEKDEKTGHLQSVVENCTEALELNKKYVKALVRRLRAYEILGKKQDALLDVTRVLVLDDSQGTGLAETIGRLLKSIGRDLAREQFPSLPPLEPTKHLMRTFVESFLWQDDLSDARLRELWLSQAPPQSQSESQANQSDAAEVSLDQVGDLGLEQQTEQALPIVVEHEADNNLVSVEALQMEGFDREPFVMAVALFREDKYRGVTELLTRAIDEGAAVFVSHALLLRGAMHALSREDDRALQDFTAVVNTKELEKEMYTNALIKKAGVLAGHFEMDKCKHCFDKAMAIDPTCIDVNIHRARVGLESEDAQGLAAVLDDLEKAVELAPDYPNSLYCLATAYHRIASMQQSMQLLESAKRKFEAAVEKFPKFVDGLILYSLFLQDVSDHSKAEEVLNRAVKLQPDNPLVHFSLGILSLAYRQDVDKAVSAMQTAIAVDVSCVQAYDTLASLEIQRGNNDRAMELYEQGVQNARSMVEMSQAFVAREIISAQEKACKEYGISTFQAPGPLPMAGFH